MGAFGTYKVGGIAIAAQPLTTGSIFFVDSGNVDGDDSPNSGANPNVPFSTVNYAISRCTANNGDRIYLMPGHNESLIAVTSFVVDKAGIEIIGLGFGQSRPTFDYDHVNGSIEMDAANCRLSNVVLNASETAVVVGINVNADGVTLDHLETTWEATGDDFKIIADVDGFDRCTIVDNKFFGQLAVAGGVTSIRIDDSHNLIFQRNMMVGNSAIMFTMAGALSQTCVVTDNIMYNADVTDDSCWEIAVASTGIFARNTTGSLYATGVANILDPGSLLCSENYSVNAVLETGIVLPAATPT